MLARLFLLTYHNPAAASLPNGPPARSWPSHTHRLSWPPAAEARGLYWGTLADGLGSSRPPPKELLLKASGCVSNVVRLCPMHRASHLPSREW